MPLHIEMHTFIASLKWIADVESPQAVRANGHQSNVPHLGPFDKITSGYVHQAFLPPNQALLHLIIGSLVHITLEKSNLYSLKPLSPQDLHEEFSEALMRRP